MKKKGIDRQKIETAFTMILEAIGEDPEREGVKNTPKRIKMNEEIFMAWTDPRSF